MQEIKTFIRAASVKGTLVDEFNNAISGKVSLTRGMQAEMILYLFHNEEQESAFAAADFSNIVSWIWYADSDYDMTTTPKLIVTSGISVDENGQIHIPILETNTAEVIAYLGTAETKDLKCELAGFEAGNDRPVFVLQWEFSIRNRIGSEGGGQPAPVEDAAYTKAQVNALFAAANTVEYSVDGTTWSAECPTGATMRRYKNSAIPGAEWTVESLAPGPAGSDGTGITVLGEYNAGTTYEKTSTNADAVQYNGSLWMYINDTPSSGNPPPTSGTSNTYWTLLVAKGNTGTAAGFGTPTASATSLSAGATPTAAITASGTDTAKVFEFTFGIPKGDTGDAAGFGTPTASASLLPAGSSPTAAVTASGTDTEKVFAFAFGIPKGDPGDTIGNASISVTSLTSGYIAVTHDALPVALETNAGNFYPIEKGSLTVSSGTWIIDPTAYLAYDNAASFTGPWTIYFAGGISIDANTYLRTVTDTLPTASSSLENAVFLYTGATTATAIHGHFYRCVSSGNSYVWQDAQSGTVAVGNCSSISGTAIGNSVKLKWSDPADLVVDGVTQARWAKTLLVRKKGSYPSSPEDGTVVLSNTVRDQYASSPFIDATPQEGVTWYYQLFPVSTDGKITTDNANRVNSCDLTWETIRNIVRRGEASQYFAPGDVLTETVSDIDLASSDLFDLEIIGFDKMSAADTSFTRSSADDGESAYAWKDSENELIFTASETPSATDTAYLDAALTVATATVSSVSGSTLDAQRTHSLTLCFKKATDALMFDAGENEYALTADTVFHPEFKLNININGAASATTFMQTVKTSTGTARVWRSLNGQYVVFYTNTYARWELWNCNSGTHEGTSRVDYQTTADTEPTGGTWNGNSAFAKANTYYYLVGSTYTAAIEGTDFNAGDAVPANTYYELIPDYEHRKNGWNRWRDSGLRQYLNASGTSWWTAKHIWDNPPAYSSKNGFLDRLPAPMQTAIGRTKLLTAVNAADSCGGSETTVDRLFLLSRTEVGLGANNGVSEGNVLDFYADAENSGRIKYFNASARYWWLRSPSTGYTRLVMDVDPSGTSSSASADNSNIILAPAFNII